MENEKTASCGQKANDLRQNMLASIGPEAHIHILRCLLNYHERMMLPHRSCHGDHCGSAEKLGTCPNSLFIDTYAEALKEAIRCIEIVHKDELGHIG